MPIHLLPTSHRDVYLAIEHLPEGMRPAWVVREDDVTFLVIDPRTSKFEAMAWVAVNLHHPEKEVCRKAYGGPPVDELPPVEWMADEPVDRRVPPELRLPRTVAEEVSRESTQRRFNDITQRAM